MGFEKVGLAFNEYCMGNKILKVLIPLNVPILFITAIVSYLQNFISIGSVAGVIVSLG